MESSTAAPQPQPQPSPSTPSTSASAASTASYYRDCSQGICTPYCPQLCAFLGPPAPLLVDSPDSSASRVSPLMIALISVLAAAFLLLTYYTFASKYCKRRRSGWSQNDEEQQLQERLDQLVMQESSAASIQISAATAAANSNGGLNEQFIRSITVFKYKSGDGLVESTDCAICLTEFKEDESLKLMPNCQHAFHPPCIDRWLRSHSNCPICRTSMIGPPPPPPPPPPRRQSTAPSVVVSRMRAQRGGDMQVVVDGGGRDRVGAGGEICPGGRNLDRRQQAPAPEGEVVGEKERGASR